MRKEVIGDATLYLGDCIDLMKDIPDESIDMILCDLPYGTTQNKWDSVIPFDPLWDEYRRVAKPSAAIALTAVQPFTTLLISSNMRDFKYCWTWDKVGTAGFLNAKKRPLKRTEDIVIFSKETPPYFPIMETRGKPRNKGSYNKRQGDGDGVYGKFENIKSFNNTYYPTDLLVFSNAIQNGKVHSTQKPEPLMEYLIKTYTNEGETVMDNCMGSGTTGVACVNTGRNFIGMEMDDGYFDIACKRIENALRQERLFL